MQVSSYDEICFKNIEENIKIIKENIAQAALKSGRKPEEISLMAVTKTVDEKYINYAIDKCGINLIGENKVQEFMAKKENLHLENCSVHLIGHLQTNKVKQIVPEVSMIQSVDSIKLAKEIGKFCCNNNIERDILIEVNIGDEGSKFGINKSQILEFFSELSEIKGIKTRGLMAIPPFSDDLKKTQRFFSNMFSIFIDIGEKKLDNVYMDILSMGMSSDYNEAIIEGSNLVRVGSSMFGKRVY